MLLLFRDDKISYNFANPIWPLLLYSCQLSRLSPNCKRLRSPGIDSKKSIGRNRFLGSLNIYKFGLCSVHLVLFLALFYYVSRFESIETTATLLLSQLSTLIIAQPLCSVFFTLKSGHFFWIVSEASPLLPFHSYSFSELHVAYTYVQTFVFVLVPIPEDYTTTQRTQRIRLVEILLLLSSLYHEEQQCSIFP